MSTRVSRVLTVERLRIEFASGQSRSAPVRDVSFAIDRAETLCIVGESGSGKSLTALAVMDLLPQRAERTAARIDFCGEARDPCEKLSTGKRVVRIADRNRGAILVHIAVQCVKQRSHGDLLDHLRKCPWRAAGW